MKGAVLVDRRWLVVAALTGLTVGMAGLLAAQRTGAPVLLGFGGGALAGVLTVVGLPSLPTRLATLIVLTLSGLVVAHHTGVAATDTRVVAVWALALVVTLVAVERVEHETLPALGGARTAAPSLAAILRVGALITVVAGVVSLLVAPMVHERVRPHSVAGSSFTLEGVYDAPMSLRANETLDMTTRPRVSDRVVMRVDADHPDFWRAETFDVWDGRTWRRSDAETFSVQREPESALVVPEESALPAGGERWTQTYRLEAEFSQVVFGAATVVQVETDHGLMQRSDGTVVSPVPFGRGAVYTVTSVRAPATEGRLRAADDAPMPPAIRARYATPPAITDRVAGIAEDVTAGAPTTYDKVRALERWLAGQVEYSIEAPLSPAGVDVVDHFLFESRLGWCQQVSTALAVMLRDQGIPARVANGFVPGEYDSLSGEYVVRERHAHQWVEVYFPGVGWQGFDPTASVPLAGEAASRTTPTRWLADHARELLVGAVILAALVGLGFGLVVVARRRQRERLVGPLARRARRFVQVGRALERPPADHETVREYGAAVGSKLDGDLSARARRVAELLDRGEFGATALTLDEEQELDHELAALEERVDAGV